MVRVQRGSVESSVAPEGQGVGRFEIRTPVAVTGVRGTRFRVQSGSGGVHSEVLEGSVRLQPHAPAPRRPSPWPWPAASARRSARTARLPVCANCCRLRSWPRGARRRSMDQRVRAGARRQELSGARIARRRWRAARVFRAFRQQRHPFSRPGAGTYVSVRAVDDLGLHGQDAVATFEGMSQLSTAFGLGVATGTGGFVTLTDY